MANSIRIMASMRESYTSGYPAFSISLLIDGTLYLADRTRTFESCTKFWRIDYTRLRNFPGSRCVRRIRGGYILQKVAAQTDSVAVHRTFALSCLCVGQMKVLPSWPSQPDMLAVVSWLDRVACEVQYRLQSHEKKVTASILHEVGSFSANVSIGLTLTPQPSPPTPIE